MHAVMYAGAGPWSLGSVQEEWVLLAFPEACGLILGEVWALSGWVPARAAAVFGAISALCRPGHQHTRLAQGN